MATHFTALPDPFPPGARKLAFIEGRQVLVVNVDGTLAAIDNSCPHAGGSLASGKLDGRWLRCPSHGMKIDLLAQDGQGVTRFAIVPTDGGANIEL